MRQGDVGADFFVILTGALGVFVQPDASTPKTPARLVRKSSTNQSLPEDEAHDDDAQDSECVRVPVGPCRPLPA